MPYVCAHAPIQIFLLIIDQNSDANCSTGGISVKLLKLCSEG